MPRALVASSSSRSESPTFEIASVKVVGLGGVGAVVAQALAQFLAFNRVCDTLWPVDGDRYEDRNRERVLFDACDNKAVAKARELGHACGDRLRILPVPEYVAPRNVHRVIGERCTVFLCVDNHASRKLVSDHCRRRLTDVLLISGGNDGVEDGRSGTFGNVQIYLRRDGRDLTNPLTRFHPEVARPRDQRPDRAGCAALTPEAPQLLFTNLTVAAAMLGAFHAWLTGTLRWEEVYLDIARSAMVPVRRRVSWRGLWAEASATDSTDLPALGLYRQPLISAASLDAPSDARFGGPFQSL